MRHRKHAQYLGRNPSHRRCSMANMLKNLINEGKIETTVAKAKVLRRYADKMVTIAKEGTLSARRRVIAKLMVRHNKLTSKEAKAAKAGDTSAYNSDRKVVKKLFEDYATRFKDRLGGYTRIVKMPKPRVGDGAETCIIEYIDA